MRIIGDHFRRYAHALKFAIGLAYMGPRNSTQLLKINTTKFQVERKPVYCLHESDKLYGTNTDNVLKIVCRL